MLEVLKRRALLPLAIAAVPAYSSIVIAQQSPPNPTENRFKIPDCQLTFQLRTTALVVDTAWLEYGAMPDIVLSLRQTHVCPTQPIEIDNLWLSSAVLGVLKINDLGHRNHYPYWLLHVRASPTDKDQPGTRPAPANRVPRQPIDASIEMHTNPIVKRAREYDIHYYSSDPTVAGEAKINCGDDDVNRVCHGPGAWFAGLMVNYDISQDQFPAPNEVSTDPQTEPGAILQFDQRLREWLVDLERPR